MLTITTITITTKTTTQITTLITIARERTFKKAHKNKR